MDSQGRVYGGTQDGKIMRLLPDGQLEVFAETKGRPLGLQFDKKENLIVCDAYKGLLSIDPQGKIKVLATSADGVLFKFTDASETASSSDSASPPPTKSAAPRTGSPPTPVDL